MGFSNQRTQFSFKCCHLFLFTIGVLLFSHAAYSENLTKKAFLPIPENLAQIIRENYNLPNFKRGLFYYSQWRAKERSDLRTESFEDELRNVNLNYLRDNKEIAAMYNGDPWRGEDQEFKARIGWVRVQRANGTGVNQLWLDMKKSRWLLWEYRQDQKASEGQSIYRVSGLPQDFVVVKNGLVLFSKTYKIWHIKVNFTKESEGTNEFIVYRNGKASTPTPIKAYVKQYIDESGSKEVSPIYTYNKDSKYVFFAVWPAIPTDESRVTQPDRLELVLFDIYRQAFKRLGVIKRSLNSSTFDLHVDRTGVYWVEEDEYGVDKGINYKFKYRQIYWDEAKLADPEDTVTLHKFTDKSGKFVFNRHHYYFSSSNPNDREKWIFIPNRSNIVKRRYNPTSPDFVSIRSPEVLSKIVAFDQLPFEAKDILYPLRSGRKEPIFHNESFSANLASALSQGESSWAIITSEEGQAPDEAIQSFLWGMEYVLRVPQALSDVEAVWGIEGKDVFQSRDISTKEGREKIEDIIKVMRGGVDNIRAILYLKNFPVKNDIKIDDTLVNQVKTFSDLMKLGTEVGSTRIITSMPKSVYDQLKAAGAIENAVEVPLPKMSYNQLLRVARIYAIEHESEFGFDTDGFVDLIRLAQKEKERLRSREEKVIASPLFEDEFIKRAIRFAKGQRNLNPDENLTTLNRGFVNDFSAFLNNQRSISGEIASIDFGKLNDYLRRNVAGKGQRAIVDEIVAQLEAQHNGYRADDVGPPAFWLVGRTGVGKSHIAKLIAKFIRAGGDEDKILMMSNDDIISFDMNADEGRTFEIPAGSKNWNKIRSSHSGNDIAVFDDITKKLKSTSFGAIKQILSTGIYAEGKGSSNVKDESLDFNHLGSVFFTTTLGSQFIEKNKSVVDYDAFKRKYKAFLCPNPDQIPENYAGPGLDSGFWSRISSKLYVLPDLMDWDLLEVGFMMGVNTHRRYELETSSGAVDNEFGMNSTDGIQVRIDPKIFHGLLANARENGQGHVFKDNVLLLAAVKASALIKKSGVKKILVTADNNRGYVAISNRDADWNEANWNKVVKHYGAYEQNGIVSYLQYLQDSSSNPNLSGLYNRYVQESTREGY